MAISKRARLQFDLVLTAAETQSLCVAKCFNRATGKPEYVLCAHDIVDGVATYQPLAKFFSSSPLNEVTPPGAAKEFLI